MVAVDHISVSIQTLMHDNVAGGQGRPPLDRLQAFRDAVHVAAALILIGLGVGFQRSRLEGQVSRDGLALMGEHFPGRHVRDVVHPPAARALDDVGHGLGINVVTNSFVVGHGYNPMIPPSDFSRDGRSVFRLSRDDIAGLQAANSRCMGGGYPSFFDGGIAVLDMLGECRDA